MLENPSTGTKCIVDAKIDTGSFATVISMKTMAKLGLEPFSTDLVGLANGDIVKSVVCMCRVHLSEDEEMIDVPLYVMESDVEQVLLGMDILSKGDFSATHYNDLNGKKWIRFRFQVHDELWFM